MRDKDFPTDQGELANYITANLSHDLGISPGAAWGIVQRLNHESGLVAGRQETDASKASVGNQAGLGGKGWAQWTGPRRQDFIAATKDNGGVMSPAANYQYLLADLKQNHPGLVSALQDPNITPQKANQIFSQGYEGGKGPYAAKQFQPVQIASNGPVAMPGAAAPGPGMDDLFAEHAQALPNTLSAPAPALAPVQAPTNAQPAPSGGVDDLFTEHQPESANAQPAPAVAAPAPSADNPNEGKGVVAAVPQGSVGNDVRVGAGQGMGNLTNIALDPVGNLLLKPAVGLGTLAYNHIAPLFGGSPLAPATVQRLMTEAGNTGPFQMTRPAVATPETSTAAAMDRSAMNLTGGNPDLPVAVPGLRTALGAAIPGMAAGALAGPGAFTGGAMGAAGAGAANLAPMIARPEDEPGVATLLGAAGGAGTGRMLNPSELPIRQYTAQTAQEGANAGAPQLRPGQLTTDIAAKKADLRDNVDATNQQVQDFTKAVTKQAGLPADEANSAWVDKLYDTAGKRLDTVATKTGVSVSPDFVDDVQAVKSAFDKTAQAADPTIAAQGKRLVDNLLTPFSKGNGQITGKDYQDLTAKKSELKTYARQGGQIGQLAQGLLDALNNQLERGAAPEDVQEIRDARQQYRTAARLEPMVNDTTGLLDPTRVAREFGGDQGDMGSIARTGGLLPKPGVTGGISAPGMSVADMARKIGNRAAMGALSGSGLIAAHDQVGALLHAISANPLLMTAAGTLGVGSLLGKGAANMIRAYQNRPAAQQAQIARAAAGLQGPPGVNMLLPGIAGSETNQ